jgi:hypothetical protein
MFRWKVVYGTPGTQFLRQAAANIYRVYDYLIRTCRIDVKIAVKVLKDYTRAAQVRGGDIKRLVRKAVHSMMVQ